MPSFSTPRTIVTVPLSSATRSRRPAAAASAASARDASASGRLTARLSASAEPLSASAWPVRARSSSACSLASHLPVTWFHRVLVWRAARVPNRRGRDIKARVLRRRHPSAPWLLPDGFFSRTQLLPATLEPQGARGLVAHGCYLMAFSLALPREAGNYLHSASGSSCALAKSFVLRGAPSAFVCDGMSDASSSS